MQLETKHGRAAFAVGDRVQFTDTDKKLRIYNGNVGTITRLAGLTAEKPREGERYDARQRRREELVSAAWREGRADPRVANELDGFMAAASQRLGEEGMRNASRAVSSCRDMTVPGVGREHHAGLHELARSFVQGRDGMALSTAWDQRVEREAKEVERQQRARAEERERRGLPPELEQDRERQRQGRGLGLGRKKESIAISSINA